MKLSSNETTQVGRSALAITRLHIALALAIAAPLTMTSCDRAKNPDPVSEVDGVDALPLQAQTSEIDTSDAPNTADDASLVDRGRDLYSEYGCFQCHNYDGRGGGAGPRLAMERLTLEAFARIVRKPYGVMPAYPAAQLPDNELRAIHFYLTQVPSPPERIDSPLLYDTSE